MKKQTPPSRVCIACSTEKPLAAFLQITGKQGTIYGSICSACRTKTTKIKTTDREEGSGGSGFRIDSKNKTRAEIEAKRKLTEIKERDKQDAAKKEEGKAEKTKRTEVTIKSEKEHRKNYIEPKQSFLNFPAKPSLAAQDPIVKQKQTHVESKRISDNQTLEKTREHQTKAEEVNFSHLSIDSQAKYRSEVFKRFQTWLKGTPTSVIEHLISGPGSEKNPRSRRGK